MPMTTGSEPGRESASPLRHGAMPRAAGAVPIASGEREKASGWLTRSLVFCLAWSWCAATPALAATELPGGDVRVPEDAEEILERIPASGELERLAPLRERVRENPENVPAATALARGYLRLASRLGEPRYAGRARAVLEPWWERDDAPIEVMLLQARYQQYRHAFEPALATLRDLLGREPRHAEAWLLRAGIQRVTGAQQQAMGSCREVGRNSGPVLELLCRADIAASIGPNPGLRSRVEALLARGGPALGDSLDEWAWTIVGELAFAEGSHDAAASALRRAGGDRPSIYLRARHADALLLGGRAANARELLIGHTAVDDLLMRLALAERQLGEDRWRARRDELLARFRAEDRRDEPVHGRIRTRTYLDLADNPERALTAARDNWRAQRERIDALLLVRAAAAAGAPEAAAPAREWAEQRGVDITMATSARN